MEHIVIEPSDFLQNEVDGFCHTKYYRRDNTLSTTGFLTDLKNDISYVAPDCLANAMLQLKNVLKEDLPILANEYGPLVVCGIPRAKHEEHYRADQLYFRRVLSEVTATTIGLEDGTQYIIRRTDTITTHRARSGHGGNGEKPRPGLLKDTCDIFNSGIKDKSILLVDDIYTPGVGIDEDGIQAMFDCGAQKVVFYAVARAGGNMRGFRLCT